MNRKERKRQEKAESYKDRFAQKKEVVSLGKTKREGKPMRQMLELTESLAWHTSLAATQHLLPKGFKPVREGKNLDEDAMALTSFPKGKIKVDFNKNHFIDKNMNRRVGNMAATFTHELAVHGKNAKKAVDSDFEHRQMFLPGRRDEYLEASHKTFNLLDNKEQKRAFVKSWHEDMENQIDWTSKRAEKVNGTQQSVLDWSRYRRKSMQSAITYPELHEWTDKPGGTSNRYSVLKK